MLSLDGGTALLNTLSEHVTYFAEVNFDTYDWSTQPLTGHLILVISAYFFLVRL